MTDTPTPDAFDRVATRIGDLDHPFYAEERDREVWNEASAVGFQTLLWGLLVACTVGIWVGGASARPYVMTGMLLIGVAAVLMTGYAHRRGVHGGAAEVLAASRGRVSLWVALVGALAAGTAFSRDRASLLADVDAATLAGLVVGVGVALGLAAVVLAWARRQAAAGDPGE